MKKLKTILLYVVLFAGAFSEGVTLPFAWWSFEPWNVYSFMAIWIGFSSLVTLVSDKALKKLAEGHNRPGGEGHLPKIVDLVLYGLLLAMAASGKHWWIATAWMFAGAVESKSRDLAKKLRAEEREQFIETLDGRPRPEPAVLPPAPPRPRRGRRPAVVQVNHHPDEWK
jgi:hypothetical protein